MIIRTSHNKDNPYVLLNRKTLEIPDLPWDSKGLWAFLISRPDNWETNVKHLSSKFTAARHKVQRMLNDLKKVGLCEFKQERIKNKCGRTVWGPGIYIIYEEPQELKKCLPQVCFPPPQNEPPYISKEYNNIKTPKGVKKNGAAAPPPPPSSEKKKHGEFQNVKLTDKEHSKLCERITEPIVRELIQEMSLYKESVGKKYSSDYAALLKWHAKNLKDKKDIKSFYEKKNDINRETSQEIERKISPLLEKRGFIFDQRKEHLEIKHSSDPYPFTLKYSEKGFRDQLENALRKRDLL